MYESQTNQMMTVLGIGHRFSGYTAVFDAIQLVIENEDRLLNFSAQILPLLSARYGRKACNIHRNIRTICSHAWQTNPEYLSDIAGYPLNGPPSVIEFIDILSTSIIRSQSEKDQTR